MSLDVSYWAGLLLGSSQYSRTFFWRFSSKRITKPKELQWFFKNGSQNHEESNVCSWFRTQEAWGCHGTTRRLKSLQIDHFLNRNVKKICAFPNWCISSPTKSVACGCYPCDRFTNPRAIQRCEDVSGCEAIVGSSAGIIFIFSLLRAA